VKRMPMVAEFHQVKIDFSTGSARSSRDVGWRPYRFRQRQRPANGAGGSRFGQPQYVGDRLRRTLNIY
jgi:hypothetical protein